MTHPERVLVVADRFAGPPGSANGGYTAGALAAHVPGGGAVEVTLREPPPLRTRLDVVADRDGVALTFGGAVIAAAKPAELTVDVVDPVDAATAAQVMSTYAGFAEHPFPGCFACGVDRRAPDGLGLRPGRVPGRPDTVATVWVPDPSLATGDGARVGAEFVWSALDCPGGWSADLVGRPMVLGRITAAVDVRPAPGDRCVVVGRWLGEDGRKTFTASTAYDGDGRVLGRAQATWIAVDPARLGPRR